MCPGHVPGSRSDTVSERSTTLAPESDVKSKPPPLPIVPEATHERHPPHAGCSRPTVTHVSPYSIPLRHTPQRPIGRVSNPPLHSVCFRQKPSKYPSGSKRNSSGSPTTSVSAF